MKISIKFYWRKMLKGENSGTKDYMNGSFCNCSKLLWAQYKKESVQIIDTQVCSITSEEKLKAFFHADVTVFLLSMFSFASHS